MSVLFVFALFVASASCSVEDLLYERVFLLDRSQDNNVWLFRGNQPQVSNQGTSFAYDILKDFMKGRTNEQGLLFPEKIFLVDISFLQPDENEDEREPIALERQYFAEHPELGLFIHWPLYGENQSAWKMEEEERVNLAKLFPVWNRDEIHTKTQLVYDVLHNRQSADLLSQALETSRRENIALVIYVHCGHGQDRTGQFAGSYALRFDKKSTWEDVWNFNKNLGMDVPVNLNALEWTCLWLEAQTVSPKYSKCATF